MSDIEESIDEAFEEISIDDEDDNKEIEINFTGDLESSINNREMPSPAKRSGSIIKKPGESFLNDSIGNEKKTVSFNEKI